MTDKQGTQNHRLASIEDLDALLAKHSLAPTVVKLGGVDYTIRTDLTAIEVNRFLKLMGKQLNAQALTLLVGTKAERDALARAVARSEAGETVAIPAGRQGKKLDDCLDTLPRMHTALASSRIFRASKALAQYAKSEDEVYADYGYEPPTEAEPVESGESSAS
jgi:hypothetical protein